VYAQSQVQAGATLSDARTSGTGSAGNAGLPSQSAQNSVIDDDDDESTDGNDRDLPSSNVATPLPPLSETLMKPAWELERQAQCERLEMKWRTAASRTENWHHFLEQDRYSIEEKERRRTQERLQMGKDIHSSLHQRWARQEQQLNATTRLAEMGILDGVALEARTEAARVERHVSQQQRIEAQLEKLRKQQLAAEEAGRQRWLATSMQAVSAPRLPEPSGLVPISPVAITSTQQTIQCSPVAIASTQQTIQCSQNLATVF